VNLKTLRYGVFHCHDFHSEFNGNGTARSKAPGRTQEWKGVLLFFQKPNFCFEDYFLLVCSRPTVESGRSVETFQRSLQQVTVHLYKSTRSRVPEDSNLYRQSPENPKLYFHILQGNVQNFLNFKISLLMEKFVTVSYLNETILLGQVTYRYILPSRNIS
jgi:hypothetical protein